MSLVLKVQHQYEAQMLHQYQSIILYGVTFNASECKMYTRTVTGGAGVTLHTIFSHHEPFTLNYY